MRLVHSLVFGTIIFCCICAAAMAQRYAPQRLRIIIDSELACYPHGRELFARSDAFRNLIMARAYYHSGVSLPDESVAKNAAMPLSSNPQEVGELPESQNETSVVISRTNPGLIVIGSNDFETISSAVRGNPLGMSAYYSTDTGRTWAITRLPLDSGMFAWSDPALVADNQGRIYYAYMTADEYAAQNGGDKGLSNFAVAYTTDGEHWTKCSPVIMHKQRNSLWEDKPWIAVDHDPTSSYYGRIYVVWHEFDVADPSHFISQLAYSDDRGVTWSDPYQYDADANGFPIVRIGPGGTVYIGGTVYTLFGPVYWFVASHDGGQTFDFNSNIVSTFNSSPAGDTGLYSTLKGPDGFRNVGYLSFDVDPSSIIHLVYEDYDTVEKLYYVQSSDDGADWSSPIQIGTPNLLHTDHFFPWVTYDSAMGHSIACFFSSEEDPGNNLKIRFDKVDLAHPNIVTPIGSQLFNPLLDTSTLGQATDTGMKSYYGFSFLGDYVGVDSYNGIVAAAWPETRPGTTSDLDIFASVWNDTSQAARVSEIVPDFDQAVSEFYPNPAAHVATLRISDAERGKPVSIAVVTTNGTIMRQITQAGNGSIAVPLDRLPNGSYLCRVSMGNLSVERKLVVAQ